MQIVLIGMMFSGKTTVGRHLAKNLQLPFFDSDLEIEKNYGDISTIFSKNGEKFFRDIEEKTLQQIITENKNCLLATGGGCVVRENTRNLLKNCNVVLLKTSLQQLQQRALQQTYMAKQRPLIDNIEKLYYERESLYQNTAKYIVTTDDKSFLQVVLEVQKILGENACQQF